MTVEKLRFGILGCGVIGPHHAKAIAGLQSAELVAVADVVPELAEELAEEHGCAHYASLEEMQSGVDLDVVCVCTPSGMHAEGAPQVPDPLRKRSLGQGISQRLANDLALRHSRPLGDSVQIGGIRLQSHFAAGLVTAATSPSPQARAHACEAGRPRKGGRARARAR